MYWYEQDKETAVVKLYANIGWWQTDAKSFTALLEQLDTKYKTIIVRAHCYGGEVFEGNAIYNCILNLNARTVCRIEGVSMSMFTIIMLAFDEIEIADNGMVMVHAPSGGAYGNAKHMYAAGKALNLLEKGFIKRYTEKTGKSADTVKAWFDGADHYFDADEALGLGLVDRVIPAVVKNVKALDETVTEAKDYAAIYNRYAALLEQESSKTDIQMKKQLIEKYGLKGVTAESTDEQVLAAMEAHISALKASANTGADQKAIAETVIAAVEDLTGQKFEDSQRQTIVAIGEKAGIDAMKMTLKAIVPSPVGGSQETPAAATPKIVDMLNPLNNGAQAIEDRKRWTWEDWQAKDPKGLEAMETSKPEQFRALYKAEFGADL